MSHHKFEKKARMGIWEGMEAGKKGEKYLILLYITASKVKEERNKRIIF